MIIPLENLLSFSWIQFFICCSWILLTFFHVCLFPVILKSWIKPASKTKASPRPYLNRHDTVQSCTWSTIVLNTLTRWNTWNSVLRCCLFLHDDEHGLPEALPPTQPTNPVPTRCLIRSWREGLMLISFCGSGLSPLRTDFSSTSEHCHRDWCLSPWKMD